MHYHDFHLKGYSVRRFGAEIVLHLIYNYPPKPEEESHIKFSDVEIYHFLHTGGSIILDIAETPIGEILDQFWDRIVEWYHRHGGIDHWDDDRARYQAKLEKDSFKAWDIGSAIGFGGFVIAKSIEDVTHEYTPTA